MTLEKVINLFSKTDDFIKDDNFSGKTNDFQKKINLLSKTGLGRSGHVRFPIFGPISHVSDPKLSFSTEFLDDSGWSCVEKLKNEVILIKNLNI